MITNYFKRKQNDHIGSEDSYIGFEIFMIARFKLSYP